MFLTIIPSGSGDHAPTLIKGVTSISFRWSEGFSNAVVSSIQERLNVLKSETKQRSPKLIVIIGEHILHPAMHNFDKHAQVVWNVDAPNATDWSERQQKIGKRWVKSLIDELKYKILPDLLELLKSNENLQILFMATHLKLNEPPKRALYNTILREYNKQLKHVIDQILQFQKHGVEVSESDPVFQKIIIDKNFQMGLGNSRLNFVKVVEKIAESSEDQIPLTVDSTHLNWHGGNRKHTVQVPSHLAIDNILLNFYCEGRLKSAVGKNYCCFD